MTDEPLIRFRLDARLGLPSYRQLVDQVRQAITLGLLREGDRLPSVREVVEQVAINPNTVQRAYRDLEFEGLVEGRPGLGTFVLPLRAAAVSDEARTLLLSELRIWVERARAADLDDQAIHGLVAIAIRTDDAAKR